MSVTWSNMTDFGQLPTLAGTASNGTFWVGMLQMVWIILLLLGIGYGIEITLLFSSFIALIIALFLVYSGLINWIYVVQFSAIILSTILYIIYSGDKK